MYKSITIENVNGTFELVFINELNITRRITYYPNNIKNILKIIEHELNKK